MQSTRVRAEPKAGGSGLDGAHVERAKRILRLALATVLHGVGTGMIGIGIALMIRQVQVLGFGDGKGGFLEIEMRCTPSHRMMVVVIGGFVGALSWYWLRGRETIIVTVEESLKGAKMPPGVTIANGMVQDIVVALGGSFGREAAPREIAAMWGGWLADNLGVSDKEERRLLVACGTGAGLAAVYSVPISGTLYTLEHVLQWDVSTRNVLCAAATAMIATCVASYEVESEGLYTVDKKHGLKYSYAWPSWNMLLWAVVCGPLGGLGAIAFRRVVKFFEAYKPTPREPANFRALKQAKSGDRVWLNMEGSDHRHGATILEPPGSSERISVRLDGEPENSTKDYSEDEWDDMNPEGDRNWRILVLMPAAFIVLGGLSTFAPSLLGNGRALAQVAIKRERAVWFFCMLICLKATCTASAIGSGAAGGTLTPSVALGATLGAVFGEGWQFLAPGLAPEEDAAMSIVAAAAFLSVMLKSPMSSLWLMMEFSAQGVYQEDLVALLHGDYHGIVNSKLMIGMMLPLGIAIIGADLTTRAVNIVHAKIWPPKPKRQANDWMSASVAPEGEQVELTPEQKELKSAFTKWRGASRLATMQREKRASKRKKVAYDLDMADRNEDEVYNSAGYAALKDSSESNVEDDSYKKMGP
jgi:H+/Cl- antiporter ClcA